MAGVGAVHALRNLARFTKRRRGRRASDPRASERIGQGARTTSAHSSSQRRAYPFDRILDDLDVKTHPAREDYEPCG